MGGCRKIGISGSPPNTAAADFSLKIGSEANFMVEKVSGFHFYLVHNRRAIIPRNITVIRVAQVGGEK
jgi:hypothetical protein